MEEIEMEYKPSKTEVADLLQENDKAEAQAIIDYNRLLEVARDSDLSAMQKEHIESEIYEIIGDEMNHQTRLKSLYSLVTGIKENKN